MNNYEVEEIDDIEITDVSLGRIAWSDWTSDWTGEEKRSYRTGHGLFVQGKPIDKCASEAMRLGWIAAKTAYGE
jgi:hypothetical protein